MTADLLVVMALEIEAQGLFAREGVDVLYTGVGKVNAAHRLTRRLIEDRARGKAPLVVNFGTAGSRRHPTGAVIACRQFVQRDMDVTGLGFAAGETPFEEVPAKLEFPEVFDALPHGVCASADRFETLDHATPSPVGDFAGSSPVRNFQRAWDIVDMEAYALAKVCWLEKVPFACAKFVTDGADASAAGDWQANLPRAASEFVRLYRQIIRRA